MAGIQNDEKTIVVICTESRDVPALGVIARIGEKRTVSEGDARTLVLTGCFKVVEESKEVVETQVDEAPEASMVDDTSVVKRKRKVAEE